MSRRGGPKLELKLNLPERSGRAVEPPRSPLSDEEEGTVSSSPSSCVSSEPELSSPQEAVSMVVVGCPRCLLYVMVAESNPRCPQCKSSVLLNVQDKSTLSKNS